MTTATKPAPIPASRCGSKLYRDFPERFEGEAGALLGRVLTAQTVAELATLRAEQRALATKPGTAIACLVIDRAIIARAPHLVAPAKGRDATRAQRERTARVQSAWRAVG